MAMFEAEAWKAQFEEVLCHGRFAVISPFAMQPFKPSDGCLALRKLMATMARLADKMKSVYAFFC
jgi:hypothetical protein